MAYIEMKNSYKRYHTGDTEIVANRDVNFEIEKGELVIILGSSGAGKSTVLNILGGMDTNDEGQVWIDGTNISAYTPIREPTIAEMTLALSFSFTIWFLT